MLEHNITTWYIYIHVCGINASFMMPQSAASALNPSCMRSIVVTVLPFAHEAATFVICLGPSVRLVGRLTWSIVSVAKQF
jgi:hypothetical protein